MCPGFPPASRPVCAGTHARGRPRRAAFAGTKRRVGTLAARGVGRLVWDARRATLALGFRAG